MKRYIALLLTLIMILSLTAGAFADGEKNYTLYVDRNGKVLKASDGSRVHGKAEEKTVAEFYRLMKGVPVNFDKFDNMVFDVTVNDANEVSFGKQVVLGTNGCTYTSDNASVCIFENAGSFHFTDNGETTVTLSDFDGNAIATSAVTVKGDVAKNICSQCGEDQGKQFHVMSCGHFSCEVGEVGHGDAECGVVGHYACDGSDHGICYNCLEPLCSGQHGEGVCKHVHSWDTAFKMFSADNSKVIIRSYCSVCHAWYDSDPMINPDYKPAHHPHHGHH
ncbi:MAG: hypothetical protein Q4E35_05405 [Eubacteriales bacterium]|nr:hypothetical protein [Eubacteriales bacterium]